MSLLARLVPRILPVREHRRALVGLAPRQVGRVVTLANVGASGVVASATLLADARVVVINQTTTGATLTLPTPSDASVLAVDIFNIGSASFVMYGQTVSPGSLLRVAWTGSGWITGATPSALISPNRNLLVNGNFWINQRSYASGATLAANAYAHDRWRAGANGCAYSFTSSTPDTQITIGSGSLVQVVEAQFSAGASTYLSWMGTATARVYNLGASSPPSYVAGTSTTINGVVVNVLQTSGLVAGTSFVVEFSTGTVGLVQLESALVGVGATPFERNHPADETLRAARYFRRIGGVTGFVFGMGLATTTTNVRFALQNLSEKRTTPTVALTGSSTSLSVSGSTGTLGSANATVAASAVALNVAGPDGLSVNVTTGTVQTGNPYLVVSGNATTFIDVSAEL